MTITKLKLRERELRMSQVNGNGKGLGISEVFLSSPHLLSWVERHNIGIRHIRYILGLDINNVIGY